MNSNRITTLETIQEIFDAMTPGQQVVAFLRLEGLVDREIAELLGISTAAVGCRMKVACKRLLRVHPEWAVFLRDRRADRRANNENRRRNGYDLGATGP
jgi:DNA-binding NarL/FixJ family response regulator